MADDQKQEETGAEAQKGDKPLDGSVTGLKMTKKQRSLIPDYNKTDGAKREALDKIISEVDFDDIDTAGDFGNAIIDKMAADMERIDDEMKESQTGSYKSAISGLGEAMGNLASTDTVEDAADLAGKAAKVGRRNILPIAVGAGSVIAAPFTGGLSLAGLAAAGGMAGYNEIKHRNSETAKLDKKAERLEEALEGVDDALDAVKKAAEELPAQRERLSELKTAFKSSVTNSAVYLGAAREIKNRLDERIKAAKADGDTDTVQNLSMYREAFDQKLVMIETTFATGASGLASVERQRLSLNNIAMTMKSLTTVEAGTIRSMVTQGNVALAQKDLAESVTSVRDIMGEVRDGTSEMVDAVERASKDTRVDSPKHLADLNKFIKDQEEKVKRNAAENEKFQKESQAEREALVRNAESLMQSHKDAVTGKTVKQETEAEEKAEAQQEVEEAPRQRRRAGGNGPTV